MSARDVDCVFQLLDTRSMGSVTLDSVLAFANSIRQTVSREDVTQMFRLLEAAGNDGGLDANGLARLLKALESASGLPCDAIVEAYVERQYRELFLLVDEDSGGTISRNELRPLLDCIVQVLGLKTICDVGIIFRSVGVGLNDEISFPQFRAIVSRILGSRPVSHVVCEFRDLKAKRKALSDRTARLRALTSLPNAPTVGSSVREGSSCGHNADVKLLEARVKDLERQLAQHNKQRSGLDDQHSDASSDDDASLCVHPMRGRIVVASNSLLSFADPELGPDDTVVLRRLMLQSAAVHTVFRTILDAQTWSRDPASVVPLLDQCQADQPGAIRLVSSALEEVSGAVANIQRQCTVLGGDATAGEGQSEVGGDAEGAAPRAPEPSVAASLAEDLLCVVQSWLHNFPQLMHVARSLHASREALAMAAAAATHLSVHRRRIAASVLGLQQATCAFLDVLTHLHELLSLIERTLLSALDHSDGSVAAASLPLSVVVPFAGQLEPFAAHAITVLRSLADTHHDLRAALSMHFTKMKDRSCQVALSATVAPSSAATAASSSSMDASAKARSLSPNATMSRPPRVRGKRPWEARGPERIDALVSDHLIHKGVKVPPNFGRVTETPSASQQPSFQWGSPNGGAASASAAATPTARSIFFFGTKRVELAAQDDTTLCVHVGGGYLLFEEYCRVHTEYETVKWQRRVADEAKKRGTLHRSASPIRSPSARFQ